MKMGGERKRPTILFTTDEIEAIKDKIAKYEWPRRRTD